VLHQKSQQFSNRPSHVESGIEEPVSGKVGWYGGREKGGPNQRIQHCRERGIEGGTEPKGHNNLGATCHYLFLAVCVSFVIS
jgi:hypothetical protein